MRHIYKLKSSRPIKWILSKSIEDDDKIISISHLNLFGNQDIILNDISFEIKRGDFFGIIGPNGAGKTSLFKCMLGLNRSYTGIVKIFGKDLKKKL